MAASPRDLVAAVGPRVRTSPFFDATLRAGLTAVSTYNHMWLPMSYGDLDAEYRRLTTGVSMWDVAAQRHIEVRGPAADDLTQWVTAIDITQVPVASSAYAPMVDHDGTLINDPVLLHWPDGSWRFSIADRDVQLWLRAIARERELDVTIRELDTATLAVQGPRADEVAAALGLDWVAEMASSTLRAATLHDDGGPPIDLVVSRSGWSAQGGFELFLDHPALGDPVADEPRRERSPAERLWRLVETAGRPVGIGPGGPNARERLEHVLLSYGTDTGYDADPLEIGLADHLALDGPSFIGRDALRRIRDEGPARRMWGVVIDGDPLATLQRPVPWFDADGSRLGELRTAEHSPKFGRNIGLALLAAGRRAGDRTELELEDGRRRAELVELPFTESLEPVAEREVSS